MKPLFAVLFALAGVVMIVGIGAAMSMGSTPLALGFAAAAVLIIGLGFVVKAKTSKK